MTTAGLAVARRAAAVRAVAAAAPPEAPTDPAAEAVALRELGQAEASPARAERAVAVARQLAAAPVVRVAPGGLSVEPEVAARSAGRAVAPSPEREGPPSVAAAAAPVARQEAGAAQEWVGARAVAGVVRAEAADAVAAPAPRAAAFQARLGGRRPG